jgi:hypothetical protein
LKKIELDRKSHLSNIEGVIIEDVNEDEEEIDFNIKRYQTDIMGEKENIEKNLENFNGDNEKIFYNLNKNNDLKTNQNVKAENNISNGFNSQNINLKRCNSDTTNTSSNFAEYLKRLRQNQFEAENEEKNKTTENPNRNKMINKVYGDC